MGRIRKWGNSAAVRIPAGVLADANLALGAFVDVREERGCIVIAPVRQKVLSIDALVRGIRPGNLPQPVDTGASVGQEVW